jgi:hypothetical protein
MRQLMEAQRSTQPCPNLSHIDTSFPAPDDKGRKVRSLAALFSSFDSPSSTRYELLARKRI